MKKDSLAVNTDSLLIKKLVTENESLQNTIDSLNIQRKIDALAIKFDGQSKVITEVSSCYEASWNKLIWFVVVLGSILAFLIPYLMGAIERRNLESLKESYTKEYNTLKTEIDKLKKLENKISAQIQVSEGYSLFMTALTAGLIEKDVLLSCSAFQKLPTIKEHKNVTKSLISFNLSLITSYYKTNTDFLNDLEKVVDIYENKLDKKFHSKLSDKYIQQIKGFIKDLKNVTRIDTP